MMMSATQLLYCLVLGGVYLIIVTLIMEFLTRRLSLFKGFPDPLVEKISGGWLVLLMIMEFLFFVVIPTVSYSFFYLVMPFSGIRAGMAGALYAFTLGAVPIVMGLSMRIKLPMPYLLFLLLSYLVKLGGAMVIIAYLYVL
ncbi:MAG: hypothetical protein JSW34_04915 [Candidatus Zixiibacteriota bacterium]|nr:MAG: hypothetical protein JSW34_04915 [candidate division Zixibacteria bacterium]